jgi:hypothetical protein
MPLSWRAISPMLPLDRGLCNTQAMFGLPVGTDFGALVGTKVEGLHISQYQVQINLGDAAGISVEGNLSVQEAGGEPVLYVHLPDAAQMLADRLGHEVLAAVVAREGVLTLRLDDDSQIEIIDSSQQYESYQVTMGERVVIV